MMLSNSVKLLSIGGFEIRVDSSWLVIATLITWSLSSQYFPSVFPDQSAQTYVIMAFAAMLLFFVSLLLHELAHAVTARRLGLPVHKITLFLFGGVAELENEPESAAVEFWVALAGPAMSLCLAVWFWCLAEVSKFAPSLSIATAILSYLAMINAVLGIFNLLPAFPLDGGRVLRAYLWKRSGNVLDATETAAKAGNVFAYALMLLGLFALLQGAVVAGLWQIMLGGFVLFAARASYQSQLARASFDGKTVATLMQRAPVVVSPGISLSEFVNRVMLHNHVTFAPVVENGVLLGHMDQTLLSGIDRENWENTRVGDVFAALDPKTTVSQDLPVEDLLAKIADTGNRKFLVTKGTRLVGVVTVADVTQYLHMADALRHQ